MSRKASTEFTTTLARSLSSFFAYSTLLLGLFSGALNAQEHTIDLRYWDVEDGLLHRAVNVVFEDTDGFIWLGSERGLQRFDGREFTNWSYGNTNGQIETVKLIDQDLGGDIWTSFWAFTNPITREVNAHKKKFGEYMPLISNDSNSGWIPHGSKRYSKNTKGEFVFILNRPTRLATVGAEGEYKQAPFSNPTDTLLELQYVDRNDKLWIKVDTSYLELLRMDTSGAVEASYSFPEYKHASQFSEDENGIYCIAKKANGNREFLLLKKDGSIQSKARIEKGERAFKGRKTFWRLNDQSIRVYAAPTDERPIAELTKANYPAELFDASNEVFETRNGDFWIHGRLGLFKLTIRSSSFRKIATSNQLTKMKAVRSISSLGDDLYAVNSHGEASKFKSKGDKPPQVICQQASSVYSNKAGEILIAGTGKIYQYDDTKGLNEWANFDPEKLGKILTFYEAENGDYWFGTALGLAVKPAEETQLVLPPPNLEVYMAGPQTREVRAIHPDGKGGLWLATDVDLYRYDPAEREFTERYGAVEEGDFYIPAEIYYDFYEEEDGTLWIANNAGLLRWGKNRRNYQLFTNQDGLPNGHIYSITPDEKGRLWLSSDNGIVSFDIKSFAIRTYLEGDGISYYGFQPSAAHQTKEGTILLGSSNGITAFNPQDFSEQITTESAKLLITSYELYEGKAKKLLLKTDELLATNEILFQPGDAFFRLKFALLNYARPQRMQYAYRFGDEDWTYQKSNVLQVSKPAYGSYDLLIKGLDENGVWSDQELSITLRVIKPVYLRTWFIAFTIFLLAGGIFLFFQERTRTLKKEISRATGTIAKQAEELRQLDKLKSRFFANVSHELRTPLALMLGPIKRLRNQQVANPEEQKKLFSFLERNTMHLRELVNEILDLSKLENNKLELKPSPTPLREYLKSHLSQFYSIGNSENVLVESELLVSDELILMIDQKKFEKVINNFLSNAVKFTPPAGRILFLAREEEDTVLISVEDNGRGISAMDLPHVFDRFYQSKDKDVPTEGGTGIGLSMSRELAKLMNGEVWAESTLGEGSTFYFRFPKWISEEVAVPVQEFGAAAGAEKVLEAEVTVGGPAVPGKHILIVEDNADLREYYQILLSDYALTLAENGRKALDYLSQGKLPDLIISDLMMPIMDGMQLLAHLKASDSFRHLPVIMLTAKTNQQVKIEALRYGIDDYLNKPFDDDELRIRITNLLLRQAERKVFLQEENVDEAKPTLAASDLNWLKEVEAFIFERLESPDLSVGLLSQVFSMSESTLLRQIKRLTGLTPKRYLQELRLSQAREFILNNEYRSISEVAYQVGFKDSAAFSRSFKKRFGKAPSEVA